MAGSVSSATSGTSGLDVGATVDQLMYVERAPERLLQAKQADLQNQTTALTSLQTQMKTLSTNINSLKDITGVFGNKTTSSSDYTIMTATADSSAVSATHVVTVANLASTGSIYSDSLATADTTFANGTLSFSIAGGAAVNVVLDDTNHTLQKAAEYINSRNLGVTANIVTDSKGARLALVSTKSGDAGDIDILSSPAGLAFHQGTEGKNANFTMDGVPASSATNTVTGIISGVTLQLAGFSASKEVKLTVAADTNAIKGAINSFVSTYNSLVTNINNQFTVDKTSGAVGVLAGDSTLRDVQAQLLGMTSFALPEGSQSAVTCLASLGIRMANDGTLTVTASDMDNALTAHFDDVQSFLQGTDGFARIFSDKLQDITDSTDGSIAIDLVGLKSISQGVTDSVNQFEVRMAERQKQLTDEYTRIDTMLRAFTTTQASITAQLASLRTS